MQNIPLFLPYLELEKIPGKTVLIMDNASFHKRADVLELLEDNNCEVLFLPPYSPEFNPIEKVWANLKALAREFRCTIDELYQNYYDEIEYI